MQDLLQGVSQLHILLRDDTPCNDTPCNDTLCNDTPATTHFIEAGTFYPVKSTLEIGKIPNPTALHAL